MLPPADKTTTTAPTGEKKKQVRHEETDLEVVAVGDDGKPKLDEHGQPIKLARLIMGLAGDDPREVEYLNGDPLDCRRANLRIVNPPAATAARGKAT